MHRFSISNGSILVEDTNNRTNRTLNQSSSLNNPQIGDSIIGDSGDIATLTSFRQNQNIRSTQATIGSPINDITRCDLLTLSFDVTELVIFQQYFGDL
jgi:hypothetical protein